MIRKPSCLISCSHWLLEGSLSVLVGRHGAMNPAGKVRCNIMAIAKGYSCVSQPLFDYKVSRLGLVSDVLESPLGVSSLPLSPGTSGAFFRARLVGSGESFFRALNRPFRDGHHIIRSQGPAYHLPSDG